MTFRPGMVILLCAVSFVLGLVIAELALKLAR